MKNWANNEKNDGVQPLNDIFNSAFIHQLYKQWRDRQFAPEAITQLQATPLFRERLTHLHSRLSDVEMCQIETNLISSLLEWVTRTLCPTETANQGHTIDKASRHYIILSEYYQKQRPAQQICTHLGCPAGTFYTNWTKEATTAVTATINQLLLNQCRSRLTPINNWPTTI